MVVVEIVGGIGNQMFQYAMAYALSKRLGVTMKLDLSTFEYYDLHKYGLNVLNISCSVAGPEEIFYVKHAPQGIKERILKKFFSKKFNNIYIEKNLLFDKKITKIKGNYYLMGYFQCEKYFSEYGDSIRNEFRISINPNSANLSISEDINANLNSVSLHIRRGDYLHNPNANKIHGVLNFNYYHQAISYLESQLENLKIYVFSDDIEWVKENLVLGHPVIYVDINNSDTNYEDLRLMSLCKHNIIANSSFSWWGAWLNNNPNKIVIAPKQWFADPIKNGEAKDIVPENWIKF
jgi:hypothetical protein